MTKKSSFDRAKRLSNLDRTPLAALDRLATSPQPGEAVIHLRPSRDPEGLVAQNLEASGITIIWGEKLLDMESSLAADGLGSTFINTWYRDGEQDLSQTGTVSFGRLVDPDIGRLAHPKYMMRTGEIIRRAINQFADASQIFLDLTDGEGIYSTRPVFLPVGRMCETIAHRMGHRCQTIPTVNPVPHLIARSNEITRKQIIAIFLGGLRPKWIATRLRHLFSRRPQKPVLFVLIGRGTETVIGHLIKARDLEVVVNRLDIEGTRSLRHDHLLAIPTPSDIIQAHRTINHAQKLTTAPAHADAFSLEGIAYGPILAGAVTEILQATLWKNLVVLAQLRKLKRLVIFWAFIINGETGFPTAAIAALNRESPVHAYYVGHGIDVHKFTTVGTSYNSPQVTYFVPGGDHKEQFGVLLPEDQKPRRPVLGNPPTVLMNSVRGKKPVTHGQRILVLGCGFPGEATATRLRSAERFLIDVFRLGRDLASEGWAMTYRGHPHQLEHYIARTMGVLDTVQWDQNADFNEALLAHDVVITAFSSVFYQSLYAGWPTLYYDPTILGDSTPDTIFNRDLFVGLPRARDIDWPVAHDPKTLERLIRDSLNPDSLSVTFPKAFTGKLASRFIGPDPERADAAIADFILQDLTAPKAADSTPEPAPLRAAG